MWNPYQEAVHLLSKFVLIIDLMRMSIVSYIINCNCDVNNENAWGSSESINSRPAQSLDNKFMVQLW